MVVQKPKAVVFDYGGTLLNSDDFEPLRGTKELLKHANNPNNISADEVQNYANKILTDLGADEHDMLMQLDSKALTRLIYGVHGVTFDKTAEEVDCIFLDATEGTSEIEGLVELLEYFKTNNIRMGVLSNTGFCEESHRFQLRKYDLEKYFEFFIATSDYLIRKPDKRIFDVALARLDLKPEDVWYVGNKFEFDVQGAHNANIFPIWFNAEKEEPKVNIDHLDVTTYDEFRNILQRNWD